MALQNNFETPFNYMWCRITKDFNVKWRKTSLTCKEKLIPNTPLFALPSSTPILNSKVLNGQRCKDPQHARLGSAISRACDIMCHMTPPTAACYMTHWHPTYLPLVLPLNPA